MDKIEVPAELLESLETSFDVLGRNLLRDVGEVLKIPYKDLVKKIYCGNQTKSPKICLEASPTQPIKETSCRALIQHNDGGFFCGGIVKNGSIFCTKHFSSTGAFNTTGAIELRRLKGVEEELWADPKGVIVNKEGIIQGCVKNGILYRYK